MTETLSDPQRPRIISATRIAGQRVDTPGHRRTVKTLLRSRHMTVHLGIFDPGQAGSLHVHRTSEEATYVISGHGEVACGGETFAVGEGDLFYGPPNLPHQFRNVGQTPLTLIAIYSPPDEPPLVSNLAPEDEGPA